MQSRTTTDVAKAVNHDQRSLVLLLKEFKVESTGDVYMQICRSYEVLCEEARTEGVLEFGYPVFLLCILGTCGNVDYG
ncbi:hypothetical protein CPB86DRAFT_783051 [Serendipita vermifera]|nr:hypothetical protein CPB86DRAFT_783051 [Serendipita vermifera]